MTQFTADELEAGSRKYYAHHILRLESGLYAVWSVNRQLVAITSDPLSLDLTFHPPMEETYRQRSSNVAADDLLKELGL